MYCLKFAFACVGAEEGIRCPEGGVTDGYELSDVRVRNQIQVLLKEQQSTLNYRDISLASESPLLCQTLIFIMYR